MLNPETLFHERYRVIRCIKAGGMGAVYEVADEATDRRRALKVMLPGAIEDPALRARFAQEAKITGGIESDHIVRVSDAGIDSDSGMPFLVMDLLQGEELGGLSERRGPLPPAEVVLYLSQVALALDKTHAAAIVHRDLKAENLFVTKRDDGTPSVKILDFGVAKVVVQSTLAQPTALVGTPLYMAPEQLRGDNAVGPKADIYALGHIAYTLLAGEPYWMTEARGAPSLFALFTRMTAGLPEAPTARAARRGVRLSPAFDAWFQRVTAPDLKDRLDRATTASSLLAEVLSASAPVTAPPTRRPAPSGGAAPPRPSRPAFDEGRGRRGSSSPPSGIGVVPPSVPALKPRPRLADAPSPYAPTVKAEPSGAGAGAVKVVQKGVAPKAPEPPKELLLLDELTQAYKERHFVLALKYAFIVAKKNGERLSVLLFDFENISRIERSHGRAGVDLIVKQLADVIRIYVPRRGILGRYGGNALALLVPGAGRTRSLALAKVLCEKITEQLSRPVVATAIRLKLRVGAAHLEKTDTSGAELLDRASRALHDEVE